MELVAALVAEYVWRRKRWISAAVKVVECQGGAHEEDHRARDPCCRRNRSFWPHGAEACAEYAWVCYGGLHRRRRLLSGIESVEEVLLVTVQLLHDRIGKCLD